MRYKIIKGDTIDCLVECVTIAINNGWELQGGVCYGETLYIQAMVKCGSDAHVSAKYPQYPQYPRYPSIPERVTIN